MAGWSYDSVLKTGITNDLGVSFNDDYTKMYSFDASTDDLAEHNMTAGDITTIAHQDTTAPGGAWNLLHNRLTPDGTKLIGAHGDNLYQFPLSTAWDASTIGVTDANVNVSAQSSSAWAWCFNSDGTKIFVTDNADGMIYQYSTTAAFSLTGGITYDTESFDLQSLIPETFANVFTLTISADDKYLVLTRNNSKVDTYELTTAGTLADGVTLVQIANIKPAYEWTNTLRGAWLDTDLKKFYAMGASQLLEYDYTGAVADPPAYGVPLLGLSDEGEEYTLPTSASPGGLALKNPAVAGDVISFIDYTANKVFTIAMSTEAEVSTGSTDAGLAGYNYLTGLAFSADGAYSIGLFGSGGGGTGQLYKRTLTTAWSMIAHTALDSSAVTLGTLLGESDLNGLAISPDGLHGYTLAGDRTVYQFAFDTAYDVDNLTDSGNTLATGSAGVGVGLDISPDGMFLVVVFRSSTVNACEVYEMSTPFDLGTAHLSHVVDLDSINANLTTNVYGVGLDTVNKVVYFHENLTDKIYQLSWTGEA